MQNYVSHVLEAYGHTNSEINVLPIDNQVPNHDQFYTGATGYNLIFRLQGSIYINSANLNQKIFTDSEIQFVLAHEYTHIRKNDCLVNGLGAGLERVLKGQDYEYYNLVEALKAIIKPGQLVLRNQEYDADWGGLEITQDPQSAINCLKKLVNGNLEMPSHVWELYSMQVPAMTMGERIAELIRRRNSHHPSSLR